MNCSGENCFFKHKCNTYLKGNENEKRFVPPFIINKGKFQCAMFTGSNVDIDVQANQKFVFCFDSKNEIESENEFD